MSVMGWPEAVGGAIPRALVRFIDWQTRREVRRFQRRAAEIADRFDAKHMTLTANEIRREAGLPERW